MHDLGSAQELTARHRTVTPGSTRGLTRKAVIARRERKRCRSNPMLHPSRAKPCPECPSLSQPQSSHTSEVPDFSFEQTTGHISKLPLVRYTTNRASAPAWEPAKGPTYHTPTPGVEHHPALASSTHSRGTPERHRASTQKRCRLLGRNRIAGQRALPDPPLLRLGWPLDPPGNARRRPNRTESDRNPHCSTRSGGHPRRRHDRWRRRCVPDRCPPAGTGRPIRGAVGIRSSRPRLTLPLVPRHTPARAGMARGKRADRSRADARRPVAGRSSVVTFDHPLDWAPPRRLHIWRDGSIRHRSIVTRRSECAASMNWRLTPDVPYAGIPKPLGARRR